MGYVHIGTNYCLFNNIRRKLFFWDNSQFFFVKINYTSNVNKQISAEIWTHVLFTLEDNHLKIILAKFNLHVFIIYKDIKYGSLFVIQKKHQKILTVYEQICFDAKKSMKMT